MNDDINPFELNAAITNAHLGNGPPNEVLDSLQTLLSEFEAIAADWLRRIEKHAGMIGNRVTPDGEIGEGNREPESDQSTAERDSKATELLQLQDHLIEAWHRLESEQQKFDLVQVQESNSTENNERTSDKVAEPLLTGLNLRPAAVQRISSEIRLSGVGSAAVDRAIHSSSGTACSDAIRQFQRLRCELESLKSPWPKKSLKTKTQSCGD